MLVLTRRVGEQILIDKGQIQVKVLSEQNGIIALGIKAPMHIDVDRQEVFLLKLAKGQLNETASNDSDFKFPTTK